MNLINHLDNKNFSKFNFFILNKIKKKSFSNQINKLENLFWLALIEILKIYLVKKYKETHWNKNLKNKLLYEDKIKYCTRCCLPETMEELHLMNLEFAHLAGLQRKRCILVGKIKKKFENIEEI